MDYYVYALCYPDGQYFYIGKGNGDRDLRHLKYSIHNDYVKHVIAKIRASGEEPLVKRLLDHVTNDAACTEEKRLIAEYGMRINGGMLCNLHPGGQGGRPSEVWTEESRAKLRMHRLGTTWSDESKVKMSQTMQGNTRLLGHVHSEETKLKISQASAGRKLSEEAKRNISEAKKGSKNPMFGTVSPRRGVTVSAETRAKLSEAAKRRNKRVD